MAKFQINDLWGDPDNENIGLAYEADGNAEGSWFLIRFEYGRGVDRVPMERAKAEAMIDRKNWSPISRNGKFIDHRA